MSPIQKVLFVGVGVLALHGVQACTSETELNPQPLPPQGGESTNPPPNPEDKTGSSGSSGSSGGGDVPAATLSDGGTDGQADGGDAGDTGVH